MWTKIFGIDTVDQDAHPKKTNNEIIKTLTRPSVNRLRLLGNRNEIQPVKSQAPIPKTSLLGDVA